MATPSSAATAPTSWSAAPAATSSTATRAPIIDGGAEDDTFIWDPGDASDKVEGGAGGDRLLFNGATSASYRRRPGRRPGPLTRNIAPCPRPRLHRAGRHEDLGGTDAISVGDLARPRRTWSFTCGLRRLGGDAAADTVIVNGTRPRIVTVTGIPGGVEATVQGGATTRVTGRARSRRRRRERRPRQRHRRGERHGEPDIMTVSANGLLAAIGGNRSALRRRDPDEPSA